MIRKIKHLLLVEFQMFYEYRGDLLIYLLSALVLPLVLMAVWTSIAQSRGLIVSKTYIIQYYFVLMIINILTGAWHGPFLGDNIKEGKIMPMLLKPFPYVFWWEACDNISEKFWKIILSFPFFIIIFFLLRQEVQGLFSNFSIFLLPAIFFAGMINFLIHQLIGISAFWFSSVNTLGSYNDMIYYVTSGKLYPLQLLVKVIPLWFLNILPYRYIIGFPIDIVVGKLPNSQIISGIVIQCCWALSLLVIYNILWKRGLKSYSGYGI